MTADRDPGDGRRHRMREQPDRPSWRWAAVMGSRRACGRCVGAPIGSPRWSRSVTTAAAAVCCVATSACCLPATCGWRSPRWRGSRARRCAVGRRRPASVRPGRSSGAPGRQPHAGGPDGGAGRSGGGAGRHGRPARRCRPGAPDVRGAGRDRGPADRRLGRSGSAGRGRRTPCPATLRESWCAARWPWRRPPATSCRSRSTPPSRGCCGAAVESVLGADAVVLGPGSWFTSVLPHLLVPALRAALAGHLGVPHRHAQPRAAAGRDLRLHPGEPPRGAREPCTRPHARRGDRRSDHGA